ncbi:MAG: phage portal protein [Candidatus Omnitrophica bacterium]|nr:phage portal protein [Candidatus Omnitrophota bacterium]
MSKKETKITVIDRAANAIDRTIGFFSPERGMRRTAARISHKMMAASYKGAERSRLRGDWYTQGFSADRDLYTDRDILVQRSRDINRNDAFGSGITNTIVINDVGNGIIPQSAVDTKILKITDEQAAEFQEAAEIAWDRWVPYADASERLDFYEIQALVDRQTLENGESILLPMMLKDPTRPYSIALMNIESDRLVTPSGMAGNKDVRFGVKIGDRGEPIEYYIRKTHPGDLYSSFAGTGEYMTYKAKNAQGRKNVFHLYEQKRAGQSRGVPFFAPVLDYFKDASEYSEAERVAARLAACIAIFVKKNNVNQSFQKRTTANSSGQRIESIEPAMFEYLDDGEEIQSFNPNRPNAQFEPFMDHLLKAICSALNLSYEIVSKDFSKSTYSSARAGLLQAYRYFRMRQNWLSRKLNQPVWEMVLEEAFLRGELPAKNFYEQRSAWTRARWISPGWEWVDPLAEAKASKLAVDSGLSSLSDEAAAQGKDLDELLAQRAREERKIKALEEKYDIKIIKDDMAIQKDGHNNGGTADVKKNQ